MHASADPQQKARCNNVRKKIPAFHNVMIAFNEKKPPTLP